jgi:hypothetical protein
VIGFFDWPETPSDGRDMYAPCPNCGRAVQATRRQNHQCGESDIEKHHISLLLEEFGLAAYLERNCVPYGETPTNNDHLCMWKPFNRWCESKQGEFEQMYAERTRP